MDSVPVAGTKTGCSHGELRVSNETASVLCESRAKVLGKCGLCERAPNGHAKTYSTEGARRLETTRIEGETLKIRLLGKVDFGW
jgi:hypothetical protein